VKKIYITIIAFILLIAPVFAKPYTTYPIGARNPYTIPMRSIAPMREYKVEQQNRSNENDEYSNGYRVTTKYIGEFAKYRVTNIGGGIIPILSDEQLTYARTTNKSENNGPGRRPGGTGVPDLMQSPLEMSWDVMLFFLASGLVYAFWISKKNISKKINNAHH
jgi:hypothetical protein